MINVSLPLSYDAREEGPSRLHRSDVANTEFPHDIDVVLMQLSIICAMIIGLAKFNRLFRKLNVELSVAQICRDIV